METIKRQVISMKEDTLLSEERIVKFESALMVSKRNLENSLREKESLSRKIEEVEAQIINADKKRQSIMEKMKELTRDMACSEGKRKGFEKKELEGDQLILRMEEQLKDARCHLDENSIRCEEAEQMVAALREELQRKQSTRAHFEERNKILQRESDQGILRCKELEEIEVKNVARNKNTEEEIKTLEDQCRQAMERSEIGRINVQKLQKLIDSVKDEIETIQIRSKATKVALQNTMQAVGKH